MKDRNEGEDFVGELESGDYFGELGLLFGKPKGMSVYCTRNTHLLYLEKEDIDRTIALLQTRVENEQIAFLREIEAFKMLHRTKLTMILD